jgi:hypothetical protein
MNREIIARRVFTIGKDGKRRLEALVYAPVEDGADDFRCEYEIRENGAVIRASQDYGMDSMQALILALQKLGVDIMTSDPMIEQGLYRNDQNDDLGLLLPKSFSDQVRHRARARLAPRHGGGGWRLSRPRAHAALAQDRRGFLEQGRAHRRRRAGHRRDLDDRDRGAKGVGDALRAAAGAATHRAWFHLTRAAEPTLRRVRFWNTALAAQS